MNRQPEECNSQLIAKLKLGDWSIGYYYGGEYCQLVDLTDSQRECIRAVFRETGIDHDNIHLDRDRTMV